MLIQKYLVNLKVDIGFVIAMDVATKNGYFENLTTNLSGRVHFIIITFLR